MTSRLRELLGDSPLEEPEGARIEVALFVVCLLAAVLLIVNLLLTEERPTPALGACGFAVSVACSWWLSHRGRYIVGRAFLLGSALLVTTAVAFRGNGIHDLVLCFYPVIVILGGLLLGRWATVCLVVLCSACAAALTYGEKQGWMTPDLTAVTDYGDIVTLTVMLAMAAGVLWFIIDSLHRRLRSLRARESELAVSNQQLEAHSEELRASEARWRSLVKSAPDRIMNVSRDGTIAFVNRPTEDGDGAETAASVFDLLPESEHRTLRTALDRVFDELRPVSCEVRGLGEDRWYSVRLGPIEKGGDAGASTLILTDITDHRRAEAERQRLEKQLLEAQKLEALGELSGGIAHDFNNLLTVISGNTSLLESELTEGLAKESLDEIRSAQERAASLTRQLLAFGRRQVMQPRVLDLNTSIAGIRGMLQRLIGEHIELDFTPSEGTIRVKADQGQLEQVLVNLVLNARDAMQEGGRLEVRTGRHCSDVPVCIDGVTIPPGCHAVLSVTDEGIGMDERTKAQMFEPFFTTKPRERGSGLGLSSVFGIVQQSGGQIAVESEPFRGTAISVYLPEVDEPVDSLPGAGVQKEEERCTGRVLVVEDDESVRRVLERLLTAQGYTVDLAEDGGQALEIARERGSEIDLLLTDLVMPGMSGKALIDRFREICGTVPVLCMSGYSDDALGERRILDDSMRFIQKPFTSAELTRKLREILEP